MVSTIVTGVDGSVPAAAGARKAAELAKAFGATLHVLSAYGDFEAETLEIGSEKILLTNEQEAQQTAQQVLVDLRREFPGVEIVASPAEGKPGEALVRAAESLHADIIVVGNKRVQGMARVLGSIARDVAAHASCDVYVAHTHSR
ncbi:nucleotide-binding universal stress UspA family protein [Nocardioides daedukensis]|uniref:Nucleotide-binding universal stress UspA family protein n=1 Tax=Nocardioides daedukensis TaxID=634462 RepID=A0A7Y9S3U4_9ACTN|nr:universal stress protein [Nocardioides daedukensis]NYG60529.1 nucleotide-binding universal stress UspA family protein [Nocardioides daedukensis]